MLNPWLHLVWKRWIYLCTLANNNVIVSHRPPGDWSSERKSSVFFLSDAVNIQASVDHHHPPLRLFADSCVATLTPDAYSYPRYPFIDHRGWVTVSLMSAAVPSDSFSKLKPLPPGPHCRFKSLHFPVIRNSPIWCNKCCDQKLNLIRMCPLFPDVSQTPSCTAPARVSCPGSRTTSSTFSSNRSSSTRTTDTQSELIRHVLYI